MKQAKWIFVAAAVFLVAAIGFLVAFFVLPERTKTPEPGKTQEEAPLDEEAQAEQDLKEEAEAEVKRFKDTYGVIVELDDMITQLRIRRKYEEKNDKSYSMEEVFLPALAPEGGEGDPGMTQEYAETLDKIQQYVERFNIDESRYADMPAAEELIALEIQYGPLDAEDGQTDGQAEGETDAKDTAGEAVKDAIEDGTLFDGAGEETGTDTSSSNTPGADNAPGNGNGKSLADGISSLQDGKKEGQVTG